MFFNCLVHGLVEDVENDGECWRCNNDAYAQKQDLSATENGKIIGHLLLVKPKLNGDAVVVREEVEITSGELEQWLVYRYVAHGDWIGISRPLKNLGIRILTESESICGFLIPLLGNERRIKQSIRDRLRSSGFKRVSFHF